MRQKDGNNAPQPPHHFRRHALTVIAQEVVENLEYEEKSEKSKGPRRNMRFKLILCWFLPNISLYTKFHPNRKKNTEVDIFR